jgi:hypothetical protein
MSCGVTTDVTLRVFVSYHKAIKDHSTHDTTPIVRLAFFRA